MAPVTPQQIEAALLEITKGYKEVVVGLYVDKDNNWKPIKTIIKDNKKWHTRK